MSNPAAVDFASEFDLPKQAVVDASLCFAPDSRLAGSYRFNANAADAGRAVPFCARNRCGGGRVRAQR